MKVTGFTIIRNAVKYDFPIVEAILSVLPLCTDFVVAVGNSDDDTLGLIRSIPTNKIRIVETTWDDNLRDTGKVLAVETDKAFHAIGPDTDWCIYIQGDEVLHEKYYDNIMKGMERYKDDKRVDGLLFKYLHFYGSYDFISVDPSSFKDEIRVIKNDKSIYSYSDAQGFRKGDNEKLAVIAIDAYVYHYSKVKEPKLLQRKHEDCLKYWYDDEWIEKNVPKEEEYDFKKNGHLLTRFTGTQPAVMKDRIERTNWDFKYDSSMNEFTLKQRMKIFIEEKLGFNVSYRNYKLIK